MADQVHVYAGTAGHSVWFSEDGGDTWLRPNSHSGMYLETRVWCFAADPNRQEYLYAGTDEGIFRWDEVKARWELLPSPMKDVWAIACDPKAPGTLIAGTRPAAFYRSTDGGQTWSEQDAPGIGTFSKINMGPTRVTQILFDPEKPGTVWASVEIGGIYRSEDGGRNWRLFQQGLKSADVHGLAIIPQADGRRVMFATTNVGLHRSEDGGENWTFQELPTHWQYTRAIVPRPDNPAIVFVTNGNGPPGNSGRLLRSRDHGSTFEQVRLPGEINSTVWTVATHPSNPNLLFICTNLGQVFRSTDGGEKWERLSQEFGELRAFAWRSLPKGMRKEEHAVTRPMIKVPNI